MHPSPRFSSVIARASVVWLAWLFLVWSGDRWAVVWDNLAMTLTMVVGSMIAGATSEGGGAVAFPVLTLGFGATPAVARDFALMIQSVGMSAAAITILRGRIPIAARPMIAALIGGVPGIIIGIELVGPALPAASTKLAFVALWASFGLTLGWSMRSRGGGGVPTLGRGGLGLVAGCGCLGGVISGVCGSGIDIVTFSVLTLAFGVDERIATPTSVVLMAGNAVVGFGWRLLAPGAPIPAEAWGYWWAAVPVVVVGAPLGAWLIAGRSRRFVVRLLHLSIAAQLIGALILVPLTAGRIAVLLGTFFVGLALFFGLWRRGQPQPAPREAQSSLILVENRP